MLAWEETRKQKLEVLIEKHKEKIEGQILDVPRINPQHSLEGSDGACGPYAPVHERLYDRGLDRNTRLQAEIKKKERSDRQNARPRLIPPCLSFMNESFSMHRDTDVADRLYSIAEVQKKKLEKAIAAREQKELDIAAMPIIPEKSAKLAAAVRPQGSVEELLSYHGKIYEQKALLRQALRETEEKDLRKIATKLNKNSQKIVDTKQAQAIEMSRVASDNDGSVSSSNIWEYENRLLKPTGVVKSSTMLIVENPSFHPKINAKSERLVQDKPQYRQTWRPRSLSASLSRQTSSTNDEPALFDPELQTSDRRYIDNVTPTLSGEFSLRSMNFYTDMDSKVQNIERDTGGPAIFYRSQHWDTERKKKLDKERVEKETAEIQDCSFHPVLPRSRSSTRIPSDSALSVAEKNASWLQKREAKLAEARKKKEASSLDGCSFAPNLPKRNITKSKKSVNCSIQSSSLTHKFEKVDGNQVNHFIADDSTLERFSSPFASCHIENNQYINENEPDTDEFKPMKSVDPSFHPYYDEDLFLDFNLDSDIDEPPPPPPRSNPRIHERKENAKSTTVSPKSPVPLRPHQISDASAAMAAAAAIVKEEKRKTIGSLKLQSRLSKYKQGISRDDRRESLEAKAKFL